MTRMLKWSKNKK